MKVNTTFRHMEPDDQLRDYAEEKARKLAEKYFQRPHEATIVLEVEKFRRIAEIVIKADNIAITGKEEDSNLRAAVDLCLEKLEKQARRQREKMTSKKRGADHSFSVYREGSPAAPDEAREPTLIKEDKFVPKPMTVDDAIILIEEGSDDFIVFRDAGSLKICVLYRRPDGNFGLIEPE